MEVKARVLALETGRHTARKDEFISGAERCRHIRCRIRGDIVRTEDLINIIRSTGYSDGKTRIDMLGNRHMSEDSFMDIRRGLVHQSFRKICPAAAILINYNKMYSILGLRFACIFLVDTGSMST